MRRPLVSVVIPTYQRRDFVLRALRSALAQRYEPFEVLVVDDGSTDGTVEALEAVDDPRVVVVAREHRGLSAARNAAVEHARGSVLTFLDSDDRWLPHHLATVTEVLERRPEAVLAATAPDYAAFRRRPPRKARLVDPMPRILVGGFVGPITCVAVQRQALAEVGPFATDLHYGEETDLYRRLALLGSFAMLRSRTAVMQRTRGSMTDQTRAVGGQFATVEISLVRLAKRARETPRAAELVPRIEGARAFVAALGAACAGDEGEVAAKLREACMLLPELRSEPALVLGRALAALGGGGDSTPAVATIARLWPGEDRTGAALRAYAALRSLATGHPRRAAAAARGLTLRSVGQLGRHAPAAGLHLWKAVDRRIHTARESPLVGASVPVAEPSRRAP
jgi:Glycosyl transferase family 2